MRKKLFALIFIPLAAMILSGCSKNSKEEKLTFAQSEYQIHSGDRITVEQKFSGVTYSFAGTIPEETTLNSKTGEINFTSNTPNYSQVILTASYKKLQSDQAIVTLLQNQVTTELSFHTPIRNIIDGDYILVTSLNNTAITYSLQNPVTGVSIDSMTGRVSYTSAAVEGTSFTVVATSAGVSASEEYFVTVNKLAKSLTPLQTYEINSNVPATYVLDFSDVPAGTEEEIIGLMNENKYANDNEFTYDTSLHTLLINTSFLNTYKTGENTLKIITSRNIISVPLILVTKFIRNAHDLQSINDNRESLAGYYILENDIDLTDYLAKGGEGYNDKRGWNQIGIYHDLEDDPTRDSFTGTFDGNGHVISGYFEERADDLAHNEGLFGYITTQGVVKNVGFVGADDHKTTGRNFIGGFVGFNEGTIKNCWANVNISNKHEDKLFHSIGAFAGANTGIIDSCYTLGEVTGDSLVGAFVGKNYGEITNCVSLNEKNTASNFCGTEITGYHKNCHIYPSLDDMKAFDYASYFNGEAWTFSSGNLPTLKSNIDVQYANGLEIANKETEFFKGDTITIEPIIHPNSLQSQYVDEIQYSMSPAEGSGITQTGNVFNTSGAQVDEFTVIATLHTSFADFSAAKTFKINEPIQTISLVDDFPTYVEPGKQYEFNVTVTPSNAKAEMTWEIPNVTIDGKEQKPSRFCFFTDNVLTIKEEMMNFATKVASPTFMVKGTANNGMTVSKELTLKRIHYLSESYCATDEGDNITDRVLCFYADSLDEYAQFVLPSTADMSNISVTRYNTPVTYARSGHTVRIPMRFIKEIPNRQLTFTFRCGSGDSSIIYRGYACYISHNRYTLSNVSSYIALDSANDFYSHFRMKLTDHNESKWDNYDKTFVLTNDIDFAGATGLVSIGYYTTSHENGLHAFTGKIYGFGHKIKNATFEWSERYFIAGPTIPEKEADPNRYRVGFFGFFQGEIYDVVFENIKTISYNYGGCFAGTIRSGSYLENVVFVNCRTQSVNETDYTIDDVIQGRIAALSSGNFVGVTYNGTAVGLVGK